jgi:hypothetical protein
MARLHCIFNKANGRFISGGFDGQRSIDPATEVLIVLSQYPDRKLERWNGADGVRLATAQELADTEAEDLDKEASRDVDGTKILRAFVIWIAGKLGIAPATARDEIIAIYKGLS